MGTTIVYCSYFKGKYLLLFWWLLIILYDCQQQSPHLSITKIEADVISNAEMNLSDYFENFRMIKLSSDSVMGEIRRIRYENNRIYISDGKSIFIFNDSGELFYSFNKTGKGPDEYSGITDFMVNGDSITILNSSLQKIVTYNHIGESILSRNLGYFSTAISPPINNSYLIYCGNNYGDNQNHKLRRVHNGQEDSLYFTIDKNQASYMNIIWLHYLYRYQESVYFFEAFKDTIFQIDGNGTLKAAFCVDYNGKNIPASFFDKKYTDIRHFLETLFNNSYTYGVYNFSIYDRFIMFGSIYKRNRKLTIFDHKYTVSRTYATINEDVYFKGLTIPVSEFNYHAEKHLIVPLDAFDVVVWKDMYPVAEQFKEMVYATKDEDNPILLIFDFKKKSE